MDKNSSLIKKKNTSTKKYRIERKLCIQDFLDIRKSVDKMKTQVSYEILHIIIKLRQN